MTPGGFFIPGPGDDGSPVTGHFYEMASADPARPQVWGDTDAVSYGPGDTLHLHAISHAPRIAVTIVRDGLNPATMLRITIPGGFVPTPADCSERGCNWPQRMALDLPADWPSGVYRIALAVPGHASEHLFALRSRVPRARILFGPWT